MGFWEGFLVSAAGRAANAARGKPAPELGSPAVPIIFWGGIIFGVVGYGAYGNGGAILGVCLAVLLGIVVVLPLTIPFGIAGLVVAGFRESEGWPGFAISCFIGMGVGVAVSLVRRSRSGG